MEKLAEMLVKTKKISYFDVTFAGIFGGDQGNVGSIYFF